MKHFKKTICSTLILIIYFSGAQAYQLPDLGTPARSTFTSYQEKQLGKEFMQQLRAHKIILSDPIINNYIKHLSYRLVSQTKSADRKFDFFVIKDDRLNAFAGPDGNIGINAGLILFVKDEAELAAVIAHEISHVTQDHLARNIHAANKLSKPTIAALLAAVITGNPFVAAAIIAADIQIMINHSRAHEKEADIIGLNILSKSGYPPISMANLFNNMYLTNKPNNQQNEYLQSHPLYSNRISELESRAKHLEIKHIIKPPQKPDFSLIQNRLYILRANNLNTVIIFLEKITNKTTSHNYALGLAYLYKNDTSSKNNAVKIFENLHHNFPDNLLFRLALAESYLESNNIKSSLTILKDSYLYYPDYPPLVLQYAKTLLKNKNYNDAVNVLLTYYPTNFGRVNRSSLDNPLEYYHLLASAQYKAGYIVEALQNKAMTYVLEGRYNYAINLLEQALLTKELTPHQKQSVQSQIKLITNQDINP